MMNQIYHSGYLVVINRFVNMQVSPVDHVVSIYIHKTFRFKGPLPSFQSKNIFIGKSRVCKMTEISGACDSADFDFKTILVGVDDGLYNQSLSMRGQLDNILVDLKLSNSVQKMKLKTS